MGTFMGHLLPGTFFAIFAIWWSFVTALRFINSNNRYNKKSVKYKATPTMPCVCCPYRVRKLPIESIIKLLCTTIGILGEVITGIQIFDKPRYIFDTPAPIVEQMSAHVHKRDTSLPIVKVRTWHFEGVNAQHSTMYAAFGLGAVVEILLHYKVNLPQRLDFACGILAFGFEALLFSFHLHGRDELDIHIHILLVITIFGCVISCILESINPHNILFTYTRILFTMLQGTWFWEIGFILYPPFKSLENIWEPDNHQHIMFATMSYCWHILVIIVSLILQILIMSKFYTSRVVFENIEKYDAEQQLESLIDNNDINYSQLGHQRNQHQQQLMETSFTKYNSDDNSEVEFDSIKLIKNNRNNNSNNNSNNNNNNKSGNNSTNSSTTTNSDRKR